MKKKWIRIITPLIILLIIFIACEQNVIDTIKPDTSLKEEQQLYGTTDYLTLKSAKENRITYMYPDWGKTHKSANKDIKVIEVNLISEGGFNMATTEASHKWEKTKNKGYHY